MGRVPTLVVGLIAGLGVGYALWGAGPSETRERERAPSRNGVTTRDEPAPAATTPPDPPLIDILAAGNATEIDAAAGAGALGTAEVDVLLNRLGTAIENGDAALFLAAVRALGKSRDPRAHARLVEVMADVSTPLPDAASYSIAQALLDSEVPGVLAAARRRFEASAPGPSSSAWLQLVAAHGRAEDIDWLLGAVPDRNAAVSYVAFAKNPVAAAAFEKLLRAHPNDADALRWLPGHGSTHPAESYALAMEILGRHTESSGPPDYSLLIALGQTVEPGRLAELRPFLDSMSGAKDRFPALVVVDAVRRRGLDTGMFATVIEAPTLTLETFDPSKDAVLVGEAAGAIKRYRVTWSERTARALEMAADRFRADETQNRLVESLDQVAGEVRAYLTSRWK